MELENLKKAWDRSKVNTTEEGEITMEQLTQIISSRKDVVTAKIKNGIRLSIVMDLVLLSGALTVIFLFGADLISLIAGLTCAVVLSMSAVYAIGQYQTASSLDTGLTSLRESLISRIHFFKVGYRWIIRSIALSGAFTYILGSITYLNLKYGQIVLETDDIIVNVTAILLALAIGLITNTKEHNLYLKELEVCLADLNNKETSEVDYAKEEQKRRRKYIYAAIIGLILLVLLVLLYIF
jgi:hypothetical protein